MLNKVHLIGNLGEAPTIAALKNGTPIASFSLATSEQWKDRKTGEKKNNTEWHQIECFGPLADVARDHTSKGMRVWVEGRIHYDQWEDKETGQKKYRTKIIASRLLFLSHKDQQDVKAEADGNVKSSPETDLQFPDPEPADAPSPNRAAWEKEKARVAEKVTVKKKTPPAPFIDDDIPF